MDDVELFVFGALFASTMAVTAHNFSLIVRVCADVAIAVVACLGLYLLGLSVLGPMHLLAADLGVVLVVGAFGMGGLLPPGMLERNLD